MKMLLETPIGIYNTRNQSTESTLYMRSVAHLLSWQIYSDMLKYGCTRLEIGVQSVYEDVARDTNRYL